MFVGVEPFARGRLVALKRDLSHFLGYELTTGQVFDVQPLRTNRKLRTYFRTVVDVPGREILWVPDLHLPSVNNCEAKWRNFGAAARSRTGIETDVVNPRGAR